MLRTFDTYTKTAVSSLFLVISMLSDPVQLKCNNIAWLGYPMLTCQRRASLPFTVSRHTRNSACSPIFLIGFARKKMSVAVAGIHFIADNLNQLWHSRSSQFELETRKKNIFQRKKIYDKMKGENIYIWNDMINMRMGRLRRIRLLPSMRIENVRFFKNVEMEKNDGKINKRPRKK